MPQRGFLALLCVAAEASNPPARLASVEEASVVHPCSRHQAGPAVCALLGHNPSLWLLRWLETTVLTRLLMAPKLTLFHHFCQVPRSNPCISTPYVISSFFGSGYSFISTFTTHMGIMQKVKELSVTRVDNKEMWPSYYSHSSSISWKH